MCVQTQGLNNFPEYRPLIMTLGEQIFDEQGKMTGTRVLPGSKIEVSFQGSGKILGVEQTDMGTYESVMRPDGVIYGEGQGVVMTKNGEMISWTATGIGKPTGTPPAASYRYSCTFQTSSQKLARLNTVLGVGEFEVDQNGNYQNQCWEWK